MVLQNRLSLKTFLLLTAVTLISSGAALTGEVLSERFPPITLSTLRFLLGTLFLYFLLAVKREKVFFYLKDLPLFLLLAFSGIVFYNLIMFHGLRFTSAVNCSLITSTSAALMYLFALIILKEPFRLRHLWGILLAFGGVFLAMAGSIDQPLLSLQLNPGDLWILLSTILWAVYSVAGKTAMKKYSPLATTTITCTVGTAALLFIAAFKKTFFPLPELSASLWIQLIFLGTISTGLAFYWWYQAIEEAGASYSAMFLNVVPLSTLLLSQILMHQPVTAFQVSGVFLVVLGLFLIM